MRSFLPPALSQTWAQLTLQAQALQRQGRAAEAIPLARRAMPLAKLEASENTVPATYFILGSLYRDTGNCSEARANFAHALALWEKQRNPEPRYILNALLSGIGVACECDDNETARRLYKAHASELERTAATPRERAKVLSLRAALERGRSRYTEAEDLLRHAVQLLESDPDAKPIDTAEDRSTLAMLLYRRGRREEALAEANRAIDIFAATPRHPSLIAALNNAACALAELGRRDQAGRTFQQALALSTELYGEDNRTTARIMLSYARVLREDRQAPAADALRKKGAAAFRRSLLRDGNTVSFQETQLTRE